MKVWREFFNRHGKIELISPEFSYLFGWPGERYFRYT